MDELSRSMVHNFERWAEMRQIELTTVDNGHKNDLSVIEGSKIDDRVQKFIEKIGKQEVSIF